MSGDKPRPTPPVSMRPPRIIVEDDRTSLHPAALRRAFLDHLQYSRVRVMESSTQFDRFVALSLAVRDRLTLRWSTTQQAYTTRDVKRAYYLSAECLLVRFP